MKNCVFVLVLIAAATLITAGQAKGEKMKNEILKLEEAFTQAVIKNDVKAVENIVTDDWMIIDADGRVIDRTRFLEVMRSGALTHEEMKSEEEQVRIYGDTAIVTALVSVKGAYAGTRFSSHERATDVFIRRDGKWRCVLTHTTRLSKK